MMSLMNTNYSGVWAKTLNHQGHEGTLRKYARTLRLIKHLLGGYSGSYCLVNCTDLDSKVSTGIQEVS